MDHFLLTDSAEVKRLPSWATKNALGLHGNTAPGRIRLLDNALSLLQITPFSFLQQLTPSSPSSAKQPPPLSRKLFASQCESSGDSEGTPMVDVVVDVGVGDDPSTTLELATALQQSAGVLVVGTEVDADRLKHSEAVLAAAAAAEHGNSADVVGRISLRLGTTDFRLPLNLDSIDGSSDLERKRKRKCNHERPVLVRVMNVLRDYPVPDAIVALRKLYWQVEPGGFLVEGSAETEGRIAMVMVLQRNLLEENTGDSDSDDEEEIFISAVIFTADLEALALDPDYATTAPASWFNRHNHLPRLYRGFCDASECLNDKPPAWAAPMRSFLERWEATDTDTDTALDGKAEGITCVTERFVKSAMELEAREKTGSLVVDWANQGIVVWVPGEKSLVLPDLEEWTYYRQRTIR